MRILHADSARTWRGGQNQVLLTSRGMAARGHEVWLACQRGAPLEARAREAGLAVRPMAFHGFIRRFIAKLGVEPRWVGHVVAVRAARDCLEIARRVAMRDAERVQVIHHGRRITEGEVRVELQPVSRERNWQN